MASFINWVVSHQGIVAGLVIAILDFVFAVMPSWSSNGILHWIYLQVSKLVNKAPPAASPPAA